MPVSAKDVHVALGVDDRNVTVAGGGFGASDKAEFVVVEMRHVLVRAAKHLSLLHLLVVLVERLVRVLDDECVHHRHRGRCAETFPAVLTVFAGGLVWGT